ncbi:MAG: DUF975 family protein [Oscillospiraceae bacterium]|nr:DUF975 family protein [Oscillospiraceae bacterium]
MSISGYKDIALEKLNGKWFSAVTAQLIAMFLGASVFFYNRKIYGVYGSNAENEEVVNAISNYLDTPAGSMLLIWFLLLIGIGVILSILSLVMGGAVSLGYAKYNLDLVDGKHVSVKDLFSQLNLLWKGFVMKLLTMLYVLLWTFVFVIPGIVKSYAYAMTPYILYENPNMSVNDAISHSEDLMEGKKMKLFLLQISFWGWQILCMMIMMLVKTCIVDEMIITDPKNTVMAFFVAFLSGVGYWVIYAYGEAATAAFYRDITTVKAEQSELII